MGIVREEMDKIGQEFYLPALHPREIWEASGRWVAMGETCFASRTARAPTSVWHDPRRSHD